MKHIDLHHRSTERISQLIFYFLIGITFVVFALFYLLGYQQPYLDNPDFNEPLLTNLLIFAMYGFIFIALCVTIWAVRKEIRCGSNQSRLIYGIPVRLIRRCVAGGTCLLMLITFAFASTNPVVSNGKNFTNNLLLRIADQLIYTSSILLIVAVGAVGYGKKEKKKNNENKWEKKEFEIRRVEMN